MHPKALLDTCAELVGQVVRFEHPADAVVARFFASTASLVAGARHAQRDGLRHPAPQALFDHLAPSACSGRERRLAILGFMRRANFPPPR